MANSSAERFFPGNILPATLFGSQRSVRTYTPEDKDRVQLLVRASHDRSGDREDLVIVRRNFTSNIYVESDAPGSFAGTSAPGNWGSTDFNNNVFSEEKPYNYEVSIFFPRYTRQYTNIPVGDAFRYTGAEDSVYRPFYLSQRRGIPINSLSNEEYFSYMLSTMEPYIGYPIVFANKNPTKNVVALLHGAFIHPNRWYRRGGSWTTNPGNDDEGGEIAYDRFVFQLRAAVSPVPLIASVPIFSIYIMTNPKRVDTDGIKQAKLDQPYPTIGGDVSDIVERMTLEIDTHRLDNALSNPQGIRLTNTEETIAGYLTFNDEANVVLGTILVGDHRFNIESFIRESRNKAYATLTRVIP